MSVVLLLEKPQLSASYSCSQRSLSPINSVLTASFTPQLLSRSPLLTESMHIPGVSLGALHKADPHTCAPTSLQ